MKTVRIADIKPNDIVDGDGICVSIWFQGCPHRCPGCHNPETWDFNSGTEWAIHKLKQHTLMLLNKHNVPRNLSLLGGEPLCKENIDAAMELLKAVKQQYPNLTTYVWTGYTIEELKRKYNSINIFNDIDILIEGRFILAQRDITLKFRGSPNQRILYKKNGDF